MKTDDIDHALAALMPPQRAAWRKQWTLYRKAGGGARLDTWLYFEVRDMLHLAEKRLKAHGS